MMKEENQLTLLIRGIIYNRTAFIGLGITIIVISLLIFAPFVIKDPNKPDFGNLLQPPNLKALFGTDGLGRNVLTRILYGGRISLFISIISISLSSMMGVLIGLVSGYSGSRTDSIIMRGIDVLMAFPDFVLALVLTTSIGFGMVGMIIAIAIAYTPNFARLARGGVLSVKEQEFVEAARSIGVSNLKIMFSEILPNCIAPIIVQATIGMGFVIIMEAGLSFLGIGIQSPNLSWGSILAEGREYMAVAPWIVTLDGIIITITVLGINLLGDGLRDTLDPKLKTEIKSI